MKIKDITKEQAIEIAKLAYPFPEYIKSDFDFQYIPYEPISKTNYEECPEHVDIRFKGIIAGTKEAIFCLTLYNWFDLYMSWLEKKTEEQNYYDSHYFPLRNQHKIYAKFKEWNLQPEEKEW
jgi:hypothetical protein